MHESPILIIGNNGKTGVRVNQRLKARGYATRSVSRSTHPAFDWANPETWRPAITGTSAAYVTYQPDLAVPQAESDIKAFMQTATECGVQHVVLLSGRGEEGARRAEEVVKAGGISWNVVRASWFYQNFSESFMSDGILAGELVLPAADTVEPFIDAEDIADVVVATLTEPGHRNRTYEVTGPRAMTFAQCVAEISAALGRTVEFKGIPVDDYIDALRVQDMPEDLQWLLRELFTVVLDGRNSQVTSGVQAALGRPPLDFKAYVQRTITSGVWAAGEQQECA